MDLTPSTLPFPLEHTKKSKSNNNHPFDDPLCNLNLKETAEFVRSFPVPNNSNNRRGEPTMPCTPGRPLFSFTTSSRRSTFPSKWEDAEKWVTESPSHHAQSLTLRGVNCDVYVEKSRVSVDKKAPKETVPSFTKSCSALSDRHGFTTNGTSSIIPFDDLLKDKFTNEVVQVLGKSGYTEPTKEGFIFRNKKTGCQPEPMKDAGTEVVHEVKHRDMGTEMTPLGSSTTSRCHTPIKSASPARHNTPENRSGPLAMIGPNAIDMTQLQECHLAKLNLGKQLDSVTSNWSSREEEEEDVSKSLRHFEIDNGCRRSISESRACVWEEEDRTKSCFRYQREEAKIQAWLNLQTARAEAQSRKLEVKIQKMRSNMEEKLMKKVATAQRKAAEWRAEAQLEHSEQIRKAAERTQKMMITHKNSLFSSPTTIPISCGCLPCNSTLHF